jgi:hypothetical protein
MSRYGVTIRGNVTSVYPQLDLHFDICEYVYIYHLLLTFRYCAFYRTVIYVLLMSVTFNIDYFPKADIFSIFWT